MKLSLAGLLFLILFSCRNGKHNEKPNILIIVADDLGYSDLGCYGGEINTPNIDMLSENGIRFTQFYNSARCCPSRASLLTGLFPHQTGIGSFVGPDQNVPGYAGKLKTNTITIAEVLKEAGYRTFGAGKWHVNLPGPTERGFEAFYGFLHDYGIDSWEPKWMKKYPKEGSVRKYKPGKFFATNAITDYAIDFLDLAGQTPDKPWFLYLSYQAVHFPLQAPKEDIEKYKEIYNAGWDVIRQNRFERMKEIGVIDPDEKLSGRSKIPIPEIAERDGVPGDGKHNPAWELLDPARKADLSRRMAVYAGMLDNMDQNIGRIIKYLRKNNDFENTLILFMSDNGACAEWAPFGFEYPDYNDRISGSTPGHPNVLHTGNDLEKLGGPDGPLFSYGSGWANACNTPFTLYKQYVHEGGISSPLIIHWPERIKGNKIFKEQYAHVIDVMATCVEISGANYPITYKGKNITPMEGISLFKIMNGKVDDKRLLTFEHYGHPAIRMGDWKLVSGEPALDKESIDNNADFELYNISSDRSETTNLSEIYPDKVEELKKVMIKEFKRIHVFPKP